MADDNDNDVRRVGIWLGIIVSALIIVGSMAGVVFAYSDVQHRADSNTRRIERVEEALTAYNDKLDTIIQELRSDGR